MPFLLKSFKTYSELYKFSPQITLEKEMIVYIELAN